MLLLLLQLGSMWQFLKIKDYAENSPPNYVEYATGAKQT